MPDNERIGRVNSHLLMETTFMRAISNHYEGCGDTQTPGKFAITLHEIYEKIGDRESRTLFKEKMQELVNTFPEHLEEMYFMPLIHTNLSAERVAIQSIIGEIKKLILDLCKTNENQDWPSEVRKLWSIE